MLALQQCHEQSNKCSLNILPCRINHSGPSKVTKRFWSPNSEKDGTKTAYFRGRRLHSRVVKVPEGYEGVVATATDRVLPKEISNIHPNEHDIEELNQEEATEPVKILEAAATFDEVAIWGHDQIPAADDPFAKGIEEWIAFAQAIHSQPLAGSSPKATKSS